MATNKSAKAKAIAKHKALQKNIDKRDELTFKQFKEIAKFITVECPCCGDMFLLSDAKFQLKAEKIKSWLGNYNKRLAVVAEREGQLIELQDQLKLEKEEIANERRLLKAELSAAAKKISQDAIAKSEGVKLGKFLEHWIPYFKPLLKEFNPCDYIYLGMPVDFLVFEGKEQNEIKRIIFLEAKSRKSQLSVRERQIRRCIEQGAVDFRVIRVDDKMTDIRVYPHKDSPEGKARAKKSKENMARIDKYFEEKEREEKNKKAGNTTK